MLSEWEAGRRDRDLSDAGCNSLQVGKKSRRKWSNLPAAFRKISPMTFPIIQHLHQCFHRRVYTTSTRRHSRPHRDPGLSADFRATLVPATTFCLPSSALSPAWRARFSINLSPFRYRPCDRIVVDDAIVIWSCVALHRARMSAHDRGQGDGELIGRLSNHAVLMAVFSPRLSAGSPARCSPSLPW